MFFGFGLGLVFFGVAYFEFIGPGKIAHDKTLTFSVLEKRGEEQAFTEHLFIYEDK